MKTLFGRKLVCVVVGVLCVTAMSVFAASEGKVSGELKKWHKVTIDFEGSNTSESATPNPFTDYRLDVTFKNGGKTYVVPGYYAADGNAANTSANSGNVWRVHFAPAATGECTWTASFRKGKSIVASDDLKAGESAGFMDGATGKFSVAPTDKTGRDMRAKGLLEYVGKHHLRFAETGEYFLKAGVDAPENLLSYEDFDGDFKKDGNKDNLVKNWAPHVKDWRTGDPSWQDGKGKGLIGAVNYLASQGLNAFSFLTLNIEGDDRNVFPYTTYKERERIDCSRMDQWEMVFEHGDRLGMYLHFKTQEAENVNLLDDGNMGPQRALYYRELMARFGHHLALNWNLGEEVGLGSKVGTEKKQAWAKYFAMHDPYNHHIVIHNGNNHYDLLGDASDLTGFSLQTSQRDFSNVHNSTLNYINRSVKAGKPWVVACDEPGDASHALIPDAEDPTHNNPRKNALWGNIMAGGAGVEWYFGYAHAHSDLTCQDFRAREGMWVQSRIALQFFAENKIPFWDMTNADDKVSTKGDYCLYAPGKLYLAYLKDSKPTTLDLSGEKGIFEVMWFNPRTGGALQSGSAQVLTGGTKAMLGNPPSDSGKDWLAVVRPGDPNRNYPPGVSAGADITAMLPRSGNTVTLDLNGNVSDDGKGGGNLTAKWAKVSGSGKVEFSNASAVATKVTLQGTGKYKLALTANDGTQTADASITITVEPFQSRVTRSISAIDDAYIEGDNVLSGKSLKVEGTRRISMIKFALKNVPPTILDAQLRLTGGEDAGSGPLSVFRGSHSNWTAATLKKDTAPKQGELLGKESVSVGQGQSIMIPVKSLIKGDGTYTLVVTLENGSNDIWFNSMRTTSGPELVVTFEDPDAKYSAFGTATADIKVAPKSAPAESVARSFKYTYDVKKAKKVHKQTNGIVVVEAEDFDAADRQDHRKWYLTALDVAPYVKPDPDPSHAEGACGGAYLELLPDTRVTDSDPLVNGVSFSNVPGQCSVLYYPVVITEPGRYYVWVRMNCTGAEDNGLHVGLDGTWPESGARLQFTGQYGQWQWDSRQRTESVHTGVLGQIWLDIEKPGLHTIMFSMREDGFEFDRFMLTKKKNAMKSKSLEAGPSPSPAL